MRAAPAGFPLGLAAAALVYLVLRGAVLAGRFEETCHPGYELTLVGNIAHAASTGWSGPPLSAYFDNCGGHLACGLLGAPLFALLGDSYLTLKLVPLLLGLGALSCLWAILAPRAGRAAATLACLAFALGPPLLTRLSVTAMGNHFESLLALFACYLAWLRWNESDGGRVRATLFGLVAGLAVFFYMGSLLWLALMALAHVRARGPRAAASDGLRMAPGLALGLSPVAWIVVAVPGRLENFLSFNLGAEARPTLREAGARAWEVVAHVLPSSGLYPDAGPLPGRLAELCLLAACVSAWCWAVGAALRGRSGAFALPLALYPPALLAAFAFSRFDFESLTSLAAAPTRRYLAPFFGLGLLGLGFAYGEWSRNPRRALAVLVLATVPSSLALALPPERASPSGADYRGWSSRYLARVLLRDVQPGETDERPRWDFARVVSGLADVPEAERNDVALGLGYYVSWTVPSDPLVPVLELGAALGEPLGSDALQGVGAYLRESCASGAWNAAGAGAYLARLTVERPREADAVARGLAREIEPPLGRSGPTTLELACTLGAEVPESLRPAWGEALAAELARLEAQGPRRERDAARAAVARLPAGVREHVRRSAAAP